MMLITVTVQIGNSDDKLTQYEWSCYVNAMHETIEAHANEVHFSGGASYDMPWQNAAFVFVITPENAKRLKRVVADVRAQYRQESVAWTEGETKFI